MNPQKSMEQLLSEFILMQRDVEKTLEVQDRFIKHFQLLAQNESEHSQVIERLPCPVAIFKPGGVLCRVNCTLMEKTDLRADEISTGKINFLDRVTDENYSVLEAAECVFYGRTVLLSRLSYPLELFCRSRVLSVSDDYHSALLFPLADNEGYISFGAIMLLL